jgi:Fe-S-cluster containining protein
VNLAVLDPRPTRLVPCGTCTVCCQSDAIFLHPECGDDYRKYQVEIADDGRVMLAHKPNGDCIYLDREKGCTNWADRPTICREMDCREVLQVAGEKKLKRLGMHRLVDAAKRLNKAHPLGGAA